MIRAIMRPALVLGAIGLLSVAACTAAQQDQVTTITTAVYTARSDAQTALDFYATTKGIVQVAEALLPAGVKADVDAAIATLDPIATNLQTALTVASVDTTAVQSLATQLQSQAVLLQQKAVPVITVVPNKS